jgi:hypothetical protein
MNTFLRLSPWLLLSSLCSVAVADEVVLKNGSKIEGAVTEDGDKVTIDVGSGTITFDRSQVKSINKPDGLNQEFERRVKEAKPDDAEAQYQVHLWARQQEGLKARAERQLRKVLEIDPNHEKARRAMGYVNHKGVWLTQDELKATLGLVRYNGGWVTAETAEKLRRLDEEIRLAQMKQDAEAQKVRQQLEIERNRVALRQRVLNMIESGELPSPLNAAAPWGLRYWGPAIVGNQPTAD